MKTSTHPAEPRFHLQFLHPRFWGAWGWLLVLRIAMLLPRKSVMRVGGWLGDQLRRRNHKRRRIAEINLRLCFPQWSEAQRRQLLVEHFRQYARGLLDLGLALWASPARLNKVCSFPQRAWLCAAARQSRMIVVTYHLTTLDILGIMLAGFHPSVGMMKPVRNPLLNWQLWKARRRRDPRNMTVLMRQQGLRPLLRLMRGGRVCMFVPDEDFGESKNTVFAPFFGAQACTLTVVSRLAKLTGAVVVPTAAHLDPRSGRYAMTVGAPLKNFPSADAQADASALNHAMETLMRPALEQYMWTFRWFKTQPDGKPNPYAEMTKRPRHRR